MTELRKYSGWVRFTEEQIYDGLALAHPEFARKCNVTTTPPTSEQWELYNRAVEGLKALEAYEGTEWGGPDYGTEVTPPPDTATYEWLETVDEWLARCRELRGRLDVPK